VLGTNDHTDLFKVLGGWANLPSYLNRSREQLVSIRPRGYAQLRLARRLVADQRLP
jgi:hypothetical protein